MKKLFPILMCGLLLLSACGKPASSENNAPQSSPAVSASQPASEQPDAEPTKQPDADAVSAPQQARPVAVMVSNAAATAGRQWGLGSANVVIEALTEGSSTNWMLWFDSLADVPKVGPVAQGKDLFWQFALPQNSILVQKGMNTYAENLLNVYGWQPLDALMLGVNSFDYDSSSTDPALTNEYCWYTSGNALQYGMNYYQLPAEGPCPAWQQFGSPAASHQGASALTIQFSKTEHTAFKYEEGRWTMYQVSGSPYRDANDGTVVAFDNVLVLSSAASVKDDKYTRSYDLTGGEGMYLVDGTWRLIRWTKGDVAEPLQLFDETGKPLTLKTGKTYMAVYGGFGGQSLTLTDADGNVSDIAA